MELISREELKNKLDQGDDFKLVMVLGGWAYEMAHIPGSVTFDSPEEGLQNLSKDEEIVVYCSNPTCIASIAAYNILVSKGYLNVKRYAGGIEDWQAAGLPVEGTLV
jgi:rhodanese-related sulfurtransferase